jgi:hypothetical protein
MEKASTPGPMAKFTTESGKEEENKALESGKASMEMIILVSGRMDKSRAMEFTTGKMGTDMKGSGKIASNMAKAQIFLPMVTYMVVNLTKASLTDLDNIVGKTVLLMLVDFKVAWSMDVENGSKIMTMRIVTNMKESFSMIWNMVKALLNGKVAIFSLANMQWTKDKALEKWLGMMAPPIRESGSKGCRRVGVSSNYPLEKLAKVCGTKINIQAREKKVLPPSKNHM